MTAHSGPDASTARDSAAEDDLMRRARAGERPALDALYTRLAPDLYGYIRRRLPRSHEAEDVLQSTFMNAWRGRRQFRGTGVRLWLFAIARNACHDAKSVPPMAWREDDDSGAPSPEHELAADDLTTQLENALRSLPDATRDVVLLSRFSRLTLSEIAAVLGMSPGNTRVRLHRGLCRLKAELGID